MARGWALPERSGCAAGRIALTPRTLALTERNRKATLVTVALTQSYERRSGAWPGSRNTWPCRRPRLYLRGMCRSIKTLREPYVSDPTDDDIRAAALQYVRKISGFRAPARANVEVFDRAVAAVAEATRDLLADLEVRPSTRPHVQQQPHEHTRRRRAHPRALRDPRKGATATAPVTPSGVHDAEEVAVGIAQHRVVGVVRVGPVGELPRAERQRASHLAPPVVGHEVEVDRLVLLDRCELAGLQCETPPPGSTSVTHPLATNRSNSWSASRGVAPSSAFQNAYARGRSPVLSTMEYSERLMPPVFPVRGTGRCWRRCRSSGRPRCPACPVTSVRM